MINFPVTARNLMEPTVCRTVRCVCHHLHSCRIRSIVFVFYTNLNVDDCFFRIIQVKTKLEGRRALWNTIAYSACYV